MARINLTSRRALAGLSGFAAGRYNRRMTIGAQKEV